MKCQFVARVVRAGGCKRGHVIWTFKLLAVLECRSTSGHGQLADKKHGQLADNTRSTSGQFVINLKIYINTDKFK